MQIDCIPHFPITFSKRSIYGNVVDKEKKQRQIFTHVKKVEPESFSGKSTP